ncbi:MAG: hydroxysqualene dehydroxylase HpnE [Thermogutta sp.]
MRLRETAAPSSVPRPARAVVIGGGAAGLAAAWTLAQAGLSVRLFEAKQHLGGRLGSFFDAQSGREIDRCQHLALGCCTELLRFLDRLGLRTHWRRQREIHFAAAGGRVWRLRASPLLPAPLHLLPGFLGLTFLSLGDRLAILRAMFRLRTTSEEGTIGVWLARHGQSPAAVRMFWEPLLLSALGDSLDSASLAAARKVVVEGLMQSRHGYELHLPRLSLRRFWDGEVASRLQAEGVALSRATAVESLTPTESGWLLRLSNGSAEPCDAVVCAVPWRECVRLFERSAPSLRSESPACSAVSPQPGEIIGVHLWFDRAGIALPNAALLNTLSQWVFRPEIERTDFANTDGQGRAPAGCESYYQVVISAAQAIPLPSGEDLAAVTARELRQVFPALRDARLLRSRVVREREAVYCPRPDWEAQRPPQKTRLPRLALAGDWTATGWPGTMEGAVRSGFAAAEVVLAELRDKN